MKSALFYLKKYLTRNYWHFKRFIRKHPKILLVDFDWQEHLLQDLAIVYTIFRLNARGDTLAIPTKIMFNSNPDPDASVTTLELCPDCKHYVEEGDFGYFCEHCQQYIKEKDVLVEAC
jgi:hypothetical protein